MLEEKYAGLVCEINSDYVKGPEVVFINMDVIFTKSKFYVKIQRETLGSLLAGKSAVFYDNCAISPEKLISNSVEAARIELLKTLGIGFIAIFIHPILAAPIPDVFRDYMGDKNTVIGFAGCSVLNFEDGFVEHRDKISDLNLAENMGAEFTTIDAFTKKLTVCSYVNESPFNPMEYFEYKRKAFASYRPGIELFKTEKPEVLYIAGPPSFGKTLLAKYIEKFWGYKRKKKYEPCEHSIVIDCNPVTKSDFIKADRIFSIHDGGNEECTKLLSSHMLLIMKRHYFLRNESVRYDIREVTKYFETSEKIRYPSCVVEYLPFIPYQFFNEKLYGPILKYIQMFLY